MSGSSIILTPFNLAEENAIIASSSLMAELAFSFECYDDDYETPTLEYAYIKLESDSSDPSIAP